MDDKIFLDIAETISTKSKCQSLHDGAVIVIYGRFISMGVIGTLNNFKNCNDISFIDSDTRKYVNDVTNFEVEMKHTEWSHIYEIHAEMNAILYAAKIGISTDNCVLYVTHEPCDQCLKNIIQSGIKRVVYRHKYNALTPNNEYRLVCSDFITLEQENNIK